MVKPYFDGNVSVYRVTPSRGRPRAVDEGGLVLQYRTNIRHSLRKKPLRFDDLAGLNSFRAGLAGLAVR